MNKPALAALALLAMGSAAQAAHRPACPYGQILRVRLGECVSIGSSLASAYVDRRWRFDDYAPTKPRPKPPPEPVIPLLPSPPQDPPPRPVDLTKGPPLTEFRAPDLRDGVPDVWFLCAEAHDWCEVKPVGP